MQELFQTVAVGEMKSHPNATFRMAEKGPVVVMSRSVPKAVVVNPDEWNRIAAEMREYKRLHAAMLKQRSREMDDGDYMTQEQLEAGLQERGLV